MKCPIVERTLSVTTRWVILLVIAGASTVCVADPIVFTNGDASHIVNGQAINSVREGSRFTLAGTTSLTSMDFNFFTSATTRMDSVDWWIYSADPETLVSPTAQGTASVGSVFLGNVLVGNSYADYTGTIALPGIPLAAGTYYVVLGDATKAGISVTTYWADDSTSSGASVFGRVRRLLTARGNTGPQITFSTCAGPPACRSPRQECSWFPHSHLGSVAVAQEPTIANNPG